MLIDQPGFYPGLSHDAYHADPVAVPSLSSSVGKLLIDQTPRHAFMAHPRLNAQHEPDNDKKFDLGSAVHAMMTRDDRAFAIIPADDYKTKAAREAREVAAATGQIPLLARQHDQARAIARAAEVNNPTLVVLLAGLGMQGASWEQMTPLHLYHITAALTRVGLRAEARMIAAEAVARG